MQVAYNFLSFLILFLSGKNGKSSCRSFNSSRYVHQFQKISFITIFIIAFMKSSLNWEISSTHLKPFTDKFFDIADPYKLFVPIFKIRWFCIYIITFSVFVISSSIPRNSMTNFTSNTFSTINNISISVTRSNFILTCFIAACHANPGAERKWEVSSSYISRHILLKFLNTPVNNSVSFHSPKSFVSKS